MPGRSHVSEVEQANKQLTNIQASISQRVTSESLQMLLEPVQVLGSNCSKVSEQKPLQQSGKLILQALRNCQDSGSNITDRSLCPKLYAAGFRALSAILATLRGQHGMSTSELVNLLSQFFTYGNELDTDSSSVATVAAATATAAPVAAAGPALGQRTTQSNGTAGKTAYRPPHARRRSSSSTGWSDGASTGSQSGSESDTGSDSDSSRGSRTANSGTASAVRLAALTCLQQLAKADCRALHPFWIILLPVYNPLQTKYHAATLMDAIVRDPKPKVRALAAAVLSSMLEGPAQKAYLIIAEAKSSARPPVRGFTTLSSTLGHLVIAVHDGLLHAISKETQVSALVNMLKTLGILMLSAAYNRLPSDLLTRCIEALGRRLLSAPQKLVATAADIQAVQSAACACLAAAFGTKTANPSVEQLLFAPLSMATAAAPLTAALLDLSLTDAAGSLMLRTEALSALCGLAKNYTAALRSSWAAISHAVAYNLKKQGSGLGNPAVTPRASAAAADPAPNAEARCAQQAVKLLSDYLAGYYKLVSATTHVIQKPSDAAGPSDSQQQTTPSTPQLPSLQALSTPLSGVMSGIDSTCDKVSDDPQQRLPSVDGLASTSSVEDLNGAATQHIGNSADWQHTGPACIRDSRREACRAVEVQQCTGMWAEACDQHFPQAIGHVSPLVRSAMLTGISDLPYNIYGTLRQAQKEQVWQWVWHACQNDEAAAVRAAALKCMGCVVGSVPVQECQSGTDLVPQAQKRCPRHGAGAPGMAVTPMMYLPFRTELVWSMQVLSAALHDTTLSVRVSAASALANVADALQQQQHQVDAQMIPALSNLTAAAMAACTDNDKVHVNGIRALGNLLAIQQVSSPQQMQMPLSLSADRKTDPPSKPQLPTGSDDSCSNISHEVVDVTCAHFTHGDVEAALISGLGDIKLDQWWGRSWLGQSIQCLETSLASSTEKIQWNGCYAAGSLLKNVAAASLAANEGRLQSLLFALLLLIKDSPNYKIRTLATGALSNLRQKALYEELWETALQTVCHAESELQSSLGEAESGKNYQFKEALQLQLKECWESLLAMATPKDKDMCTAAHAASTLTLEERGQ